MQVGASKNPTAPLFSDTKKKWKKKNTNNQREHALKVLLLLELYDAEFAIKNKLKKYLS